MQRHTLGHATADVASALSVVTTAATSKCHRIAGLLRSCLFVLFERKSTNSFGISTRFLKSLLFLAHSMQEY